MSTCKDLVIYIIENGLLDEPIIENGKLPGFMTILEAAAKFEVGESTIRSWIQMGVLDSIKIENTIYIPAWTTNPRKILERKE